MFLKCLGCASSILEIDGTPAGHEIMLKRYCMVTLALSTAVIVDAF